MNIPFCMLTCKLKSECTPCPTAYHNIVDEYDQSNHKKNVNKAAQNMEDKAKQP